MNRLAWIVLGLLLTTGTALAQPDLRIGLLWATEENDVVEGACVTQVHYILQVLNFGTEDSGAFTMHVVIDSPELPPIDELGDYMGLTHVVENGVAVGDMYQIELWWKEEGGLPAGYWTSWLLLDIEDTVAESDEENNTAGPIYVETNVPVCEPDNLYIDTFTVTETDGQVDYSVVVANETNQAVTVPIRLDLYHHREKQPGYYDPGDQSTTIEHLAAGETFTYEASWTLPEGDGVYHSYVVVDGENVLFETSEADNIAGPHATIVCSDCPPCASGEKITEPCACGGENVASGYCCDDVPQAGPCPVVEPEADVVVGPEAEPDVPTEETVGGDDLVDSPDGGDVTGEPPRKSDGCHAAGWATTGSAWWLLLGLVGLLMALRRVRARG